MIIQKQILNQSKFIPPGYTLSKIFFVRSYYKGTAKEAAPSKEPNSYAKLKLTKMKK